MQFERDDEGLDKRVAKAYDLNGLAPKPDIKPHIQEAIGKVSIFVNAGCCSCSCCLEVSMPAKT